MILKEGELRYVLEGGKNHMVEYRKDGSTVYTGAEKYIKGEDFSKDLTSAQKLELKGKTKGISAFEKLSTAKKEAFLRRKLGLNMPKGRNI